MDLPLSERLKASREARALTLEDAAHATRIPLPRLRQLEDGNYAAFGNMAYARGFIKLYSRYLGVDAEDFVTGLPEPVLGGPADYRYLTESYGPWISDRSPRARSVPVNVQESSASSPVIYAFLIMCFVGIGSAIFAHTYLLPKAAMVEAVQVQKIAPVEQAAADPVIASKISRASEVPINLDKVPVRRAIPIVEEFSPPQGASAKP